MALVYQGPAHEFYFTEDVVPYCGYSVAKTHAATEMPEVIDCRCAGSEADARRAAHRLGVTQMRGPYSWDVVDNLRHRFVAEVKHRGGRWS